MSSPISHRCAALVLFSFSSILLSMDPPQKKTVEKEWKALTDHEVFQKLQLTGGIFSHFPLETAKVFFPTYPAEAKNWLLHANKALNILFSRENPQPFMFCPQLVAHHSDKLALFAQVVFLTDHKLNNKSDQIIIDESCWFPSFENNGINESLGAQYNSYPIVDKLDGYQHIRWYKEKLVIFEALEGTLFKEKKDLNSFIIPWFSRNPLIIETSLNNHQNFDNVNADDIKLLISILIKNDDLHSFEIFRSTTLYKKFLKFINQDATKWLQLAVFCASPKIIPPLLGLYAAAKTTNVCSGNVLPERNYFADYLYRHLSPNASIRYEEIKNSLSLEKGDISSIIQEFDPVLRIQHSEHSNRYLACIKQLLKEKDLRKLNYPSAISPKKEKKSIKKNFFSLHKKKK